jgi:glycosyltransferase involved in cell wall biosynthesis
MKVALVHDFLREYGGAERVLEVIHAMFPDAPVYTSYYFPEKMPESFRSWNIITGNVQKWPLSRELQKPYTYLIGMSFELFDLRGFDIVISSSANFAKGVITHPGQIHINYCHTPTRFLWGLNTQTNRNGFLRTLLGPLDSWLRQWDFAAAQRVDHFIANSETTKKRIKRFYSRDSEVIYPPVVADSLPEVSSELMQKVREKYGLPEKYFLVVSRLMRVKNIDLIIQAFNELNLPLIVVGTGNEDEYLRSIGRKNVIFTGFVADEELKGLYKGAEGFVAAAEDEDFGMTIVEAQSYGVPIIALKRGGYTESVVEGTTGIFFDTTSVESLKKAITDFQKLEWNKNEIIKNAQRFSIAAFKDSLQKVVARVTT